MPEAHSCISYILKPWRLVQLGNALESHAHDAVFRIGRKFARHRSYCGEILIIGSDSSYRYRISIDRARGS